MRFSLRWLFAATAYFALVTSAIVTNRPVLATLVWYVPILASCYAIVVSMIDTSRRRAMALGFVMLTAAYSIGWLFFSKQVPAMLVFRAAGYSVSSDGDIMEPDPNFPGSYRTSLSMSVSIQAANAAGTLAAGLIGCLIGGLAYRHSEREGGRLSGRA
jgi:hypothetical protein